MRAARSLVLCALVFALGGCLDGDDDLADHETAPDASTAMTMVFTIQQPADPALQQLINSCASGFDAHSCETMCRSVLCPFVTLTTLPILACTLARKGPIATVTVTYEGPVSCPSPPPTNGIPDVAQP
jgi:hypothetical protein